MIDSTNPSPMVAALREGRLETWLAREAVAPGGAVWSWVDSRRRGYFYPEAAGLHLAGLGRNDAVAAWLARCRAFDGGVGRDGHRYVFDTAMALNGLLTHGLGGGDVPREVLGAMFDFLSTHLASRRASTMRAAPLRWSARYAPHLLKTAIAIHRFGAVVGDARAGSLCRQLRDDFEAALAEIALGLAGESDGPRLYVHAACYAFEGALYLEAVGEAPFAGRCRDAAAALARLQRADGALPAFSTGEGARSDATAQAVRIWCAVDAAAFAGAIQRALGWLASAQHPSGGLVYEPGSEDVNTWASIFGLQAARWSRRGADIEALA